MRTLELTPPSEAPAPPLPAWMPSSEELLKRPLEYGISIDPPGSVEIDDAIHAEILDPEKNIFSFKVHIADGGLLTGTPHLDTAREKGWTQYYSRGRADTMLPDDVISHLTLNREVGEEGQPALTISFIAGEGLPPTDFSVYKSRLICTAMTYAAYARRVRQHFHPGNPLEFEREAVVLSASRFLGNVRRANERYKVVQSTKKNEQTPFYSKQAYDMNALFMKTGNIVMARLSAEDGLPYVFRNHHIDHLDHPLGNMIRTLYPHSELFAKHKIAWYSRIPTEHEGIHENVFGHATSPLRRSPDLFNHVNRSAVLNGEEPPFNEEYLDEFVRELAEKIKVHRRLGSSAISGARKTA